MSVDQDLLSGSLHLAAHAAGDHVPHHLKIANERPEGKAKTGGFVFLYEEMGIPCESVTDRKEDGKEIPLTSHDKENGQNYSKRSANEMKQPGQRQAVLGN